MMKEHAVLHLLVLFEGGFEMTELDICLTCGERMWMVEFPGGYEFVCNICDGHEDDDEPPCTCGYDTIDPYCSWCFG